MHELANVAAEAFDCSYYTVTSRRAPAQIVLYGLLHTHTDTNARSRSLSLARSLVLSRTLSPFLLSVFPPPSSPSSLCLSRTHIRPLPTPSHTHRYGVQTNAACGAYALAAAFNRIVALSAKCAHGTLVAIVCVCVCVCVCVYERVYTAMNVYTQMHAYTHARTHLGPRFRRRSS